VSSGTYGNPGASNWERSRAASGRESTGAGQDPSGPGADARVADWVGAGGGGPAVGGSTVVMTKVCPIGAAGAAMGRARVETADVVGKRAAGGATAAVGVLTT
jgi:hypothetical protein